MTDYDKNKDTQKNQILHIVKIAALFFSAVAYFQYQSSIGRTNTVVENAWLLAVTLIVVLAVYVIWYVFQIKNKTELFKVIVEPIIFLGIAFVCVMLTGNYQSHYKYLFLFPILSSSIECSMKVATIIAAISSAIVLWIDLLFPHAGVVINTHFESDLVLVCAFMIIAWTVSFYVRLERRHIDSLKDMVNIDGLTGLYNHRFFYESLSRELERAKKEHKNLALLFIDIDYFKYYNDFNGHQRGDEVLKALANLLLSKVREGDIVSRYGGEEYSVILPGASEQEALQIAERLRQTVQEQHFPGQEYLPNGNLTISVGVSAFAGDPKMSVDNLVNYADDALYKAKFLRKNRVERYYSILDELQNSVGNDEKEIIISIKTLIAVIDAKDKYTFGHVERVVSYCLLIAEQLGFDEETKKRLSYAAYMHDIGKINISGDILIKNENVTAEEWEILKTHPQNGVEIIKNVVELEDVVPIILQHHEKYDGTGYPNGLKGEEITYLARVLTVVDCFDAMTSDRPYQHKRSIFEAFDELIRCSGTHFDPEVVQAFIRTVVQKMEGVH